MTTNEATAPATPIHFYDFENCVTLCGKGNPAGDDVSTEFDTATCGDCQTTFYADRIMVMVLEEIAEGAIPGTVRSFTDLHDYTDANMYLENAGQRWEWGTDEEFNTLVEATNRITDEVSRRLQIRTEADAAMQAIADEIAEQGMNPLEITSAEAVNSELGFGEDLMRLTGVDVDNADLTASFWNEVDRRLRAREFATAGESAPEATATTDEVQGVAVTTDNGAVTLTLTTRQAEWIADTIISNVDLETVRVENGEPDRAAFLDRLADVLRAA